MLKELGRILEVMVHLESLVGAVVHLAFLVVVVVVVVYQAFLEEEGVVVYQAFLVVVGEVVLVVA
jgi:hypothetical protein